MNKVSFDFDSTLSRQSIQDYASTLLDSGYDVWVITSRPPDMDNRDLFEITDQLGIKRDQIIFTSHRLKSEVINEMKLQFLFHLDDDWVELNYINRETNTVGISCTNTSNWKSKCNKLLENNIQK